MGLFRVTQEIVLRNSTGGELDRVELKMHGGEYRVPKQVTEWFKNLCIGDTLTVEERETEIV